MRKGILIGIGILIILLALAGTGSAEPDGSFGWSCNGCHPSISAGDATFYNQTHRYNDTVITPPDCNYCHVDVMGHGIGEAMNLSLINNGTSTYLNSTTCSNCHKAKYDDWTNTMHRVILTSNITAQAMNLALPPGYNWTTNVSYAIIGKTDIYYLNESGYFKDMKYNTTTMQNDTAVNYSDHNYSGEQYNCGGCHTTGYNATGDNSSMLGLIGNWSEAGVTCENCHGPGGNGHNVTIYTKGEDCIRCHDGNSRQGPAMTNNHATGPAEEATNPNCTQCHSPYNRYTGVPASLGTAANITCSVCHNPHSTTDNQYGQILADSSFNATIMADVKDVKLSFFNGTASNISKFNNTNVFTGTNVSLVDGNDIFDNLSLVSFLYQFIGSNGSSSKIYGTQVLDDSYGDGGIDLTGRPESEVLCSKCHYRHGLEHIPGLNLTHGRNNVTNSSETATCVDCHMSNAGGKTDHSFDAQEATNYPRYTCSKGTNCHVTSAENLNLSNSSIVPVETEWAASLHNDAGKSFNGSNRETNTTCSKCHSPFNWNPANITGVVDAADYKGITCGVCHNIHDMGDSINNSVGNKSYSWYNRDATYSSGRYKANYTMMANTTELCGNCHTNIRAGRDAPGWTGTDATNGSKNPIRPHGWPAKDIFVGSMKQTDPTLKFECISCHMYINKTNATTGGMANDTEKKTGHSFKVNETDLQSIATCNGCHDGILYDTIPDKIAQVQSDTQTKWNSTNSTVMGALATYNSYQGVKTKSADKIARAYWNLRLVYSDDSWGVHNPVGTDTLLDEAIAYADASNASLGQALVSTVNLTAGWNLKALQNASSDTSPVSVMSSVASNITVVWGYNTSNPSDPWELYDPAMPSSLNDLTEIVSGEGYWIYAIRDCVWTV